MTEATVQVVLPCSDLAETIDFFVHQLNFAVEEIWPADEPHVAVLFGHGTRLRLDCSYQGDPGLLILAMSSSGESSDLVAPNGTRIVHEVPPTSSDLPPLDQTLTIARLKDETWGVGRASMRYRDLIPQREGGRFIASHIHIPNGGPVPDYVHHHDIRFQMIFVRSGWVEVVYEDQGDPFVMVAGDCVLQPPHIRHQVLNSSDDLEVIEIGSPAEHRTYGDRSMRLPTPDLAADRDFGGQRFVRHIAQDAAWDASRFAGLEARDTRISGATSGLADVQVLRPTATAANQDPQAHEGEFQFFFLLAGSVDLELNGKNEHLVSGDSATIPADVTFRFREPSNDLEILDVRLP